jgi:hypothetical protein
MSTKQVLQALRTLKPFTQGVYIAPIRCTLDSGKHWVSWGEVSCDVSHAQAMADQSLLACGQVWDDANPVVGFGRVTFNVEPIA